MTCKKGTSEENYVFLRNSAYYGNLPSGFDTTEFIRRRDAACDAFLKDIGLSGNIDAKKICEKFMYMYEYLNKIHEKRDTEKTITDEDCHFINYWLNVNLKNENFVFPICVNEFYDKLRSKDTAFFSSTTQLENHLHIIDSGNLKKMEILYELYDKKQKITDIMFDLDITEDKKKLCPEHLEICYNKYIEGMNNCFNGYDDFYKALKYFQRNYNYLIEKEKDESGQCKTSDHFRLLEYDPVLEAHQRRIMTFKIMSVPLMLPF
ncbi:PIR protein, partial [Plasmodium ovale]